MPISSRTGLRKPTRWPLRFNPPAPPGRGSLRVALSAGFAASAPAHRSEPQQLPETIGRFQFFNEHGFAIQGVPGGRQALVERPGATFQISPRQCGCAPIKSVRQSAGEPIFEDSNTPQGMRVTELPISPQFRFLSQREMSLEAEDHPLKSDDIIWIVDRDIDGNGCRDCGGLIVHSDCGTAEARRFQ